MAMAKEVQAVVIDPFGNPAPGPRPPAAPYFPPESNVQVPPPPAGKEDPASIASGHYVRELRRRVALLGSELKEKNAALQELTGEDWVVSLQKARAAEKALQVVLHDKQNELDTTKDELQKLLAGGDATSDEASSILFLVTPSSLIER